MNRLDLSPPTAASPYPPITPALGAARDLEAAVSRGDAVATRELLLAAMAAHSLGMRPATGPEDLEDRRQLHEAVDDALRGLLLSDESGGEFWQELLLALPVGALGHGNLLSNGKWLRESGSRVPDENQEALEAAELARLAPPAQARRLGRFLVANDGARRIDYRGIAGALHPDLLPAWTEWTLSCHGTSPKAICADEARAHQERALDDFVEHWQGRSMDLPASPASLATVFERPYRTQGSTLPVAKHLLGESLTELIWNVGPPDEVPVAGRPEFEPLRGAELLLFCPNWRERHVIHRCLSSLIEPLRERDGTRALLLHEAGKATLGQCAPEWAPRVVEAELPASGHYLQNIAMAARQLSELDLDLMFLPEVSPANVTAWFAAQRVARVQATGYGFPCTTGSPHMDYFLGGADVEGDGSDYVEQLVLIPGWGQGFVPPPPPPRERERPLRDESVQLVSIATHQKLNSGLLRAWNEILRGEPRAHLELFPSLRDAAALRLTPRIADHVRHGRFELHGWTRRDALLDTLHQSDVYLDTFPYGGYNCLIEALACGLPMVTLEGNRARNRTAAVLLRRLGLPAFLVARDEDGYIAAAKRLIRDPGLRADLRAQLSDRDQVLEILHDSEAPAHYAAALDWMREQGPRDGRPPGNPVLIRAGEPPHTVPDTSPH